MTRPGRLGVRSVSARRSLADLPASVAVAAGAAVPAVVVAWVVVERPDLLRLLIAGSFVAMALAIGLRRPAAAAFVTLVALPFVALVRRLLIADAGDAANDPLILTGPLVSAALFVALFVVRRRPLVSDGLSALVLAFLALSVLGVLNPAGAGVAAELGGLLFLAAPLVWFFLGRELGDPALVRRLLLAMVAIGVVVALYGLGQTQVGMLPWDRTWVDLNLSPGYESLNVGDALRPFSTFSSNAEYALWMAGALTVAVSVALHGSGRLVLAVPVLASALLLASVRSALVLAVLALAVVVGLRSGRLPVAIAVVVVGLALAFGGLRVYGETVNQAAAGNDLITRQVAGLSNPLDPRQSTLMLHVELAVAGVRSGITSPLGYGPGATNLAGSRLGGGNRGSTEIDVSNAFVSLGVVGGLLFVGILVLSFRGVLRRYLDGEPLALGALALLVTCLGQWLTGGLYALLPLLWFVLGWASARSEKV